jgi:phage gp29-like protein
MPSLVDQFGNPIDTRALLREESAPNLTGVRNILSDHPSRGLTPQRLTSILLEAEEGDATRYLELAEDMEEKDLNYLAQLNTRKRSIAQLQIVVEAATDSAEDVANADLIRDMLGREDLEEILVDILDAIGKGYSVCEILWDLSERQWMPLDIVWRDPRWFAFDRADGTTLRRREGAELLPLTRYKYITHVHRGKSGLPIRGGLARAVAWPYLFKIFSVKDWVAFAEVYGQPYRVGKYHPSATEPEREKLLRAVANIGSDAAAIIPEGMVIDFVTADRGGSNDLYERLCAFLDAQVTKAVLGQTLTSDVGSGGGSRALGEVHNEVRGDIMRSDARHLATTLNRTLVRPVVDLNRGTQKRYPLVKIGLPDKLSTMQKIEALTKLVPLGARVEESVVRDQLGYPEPPKGAVVLGSAPLVKPGAGEGSPTSAAQAAIRAMHAAAADRDALDELTRNAIEDSGWERLMEPVVRPIAELADQVGSLEELRERLAELVRTMDTEQLVEMLSRNAFAARVGGELEIPLTDREG